MKRIIPLLLLLTIEAGLTGLLPLSKGLFFDSLETKSHFVYVALGLFAGNYFLLDIAQSFKAYMVLKLAMIKRFVRTYLLSNSPKNGIHDNREQRIQEDIKLSYVNRITVYSEYYVSGLIVIMLCIININYPQLIGLALVYTIVSVLLAVLFKPKLSRAEIIVQRTEASFRKSLVSRLFLRELYNVNRVNLVAGRIKLYYTLFTKTQLGLLTVIPFLVLIPLHLAGKISFGEVIMHQSTFSLIVVNASILIQMYPVLIQGTASEKRVRELES